MLYHSLSENKHFRLSRVPTFTIVYSFPSWHAHFLKHIQYYNTTDVVEREFFQANPSGRESQTVPTHVLQCTSEGATVTWSIHKGEDVKN